MKVLDLHCPAGHVFEGWFASEDDFQSQRQRQLVQCPVCGDSEVTKRLSAPRINLGAQPPKAAPAPKPALAPAVPAAIPAAQMPEISSEAREQLHAMQSAWMQWSRKVAENTENVGKHFAEEARRMHYGEVEDRAIRGQTSTEEALELLEEGIAVVPLALPETSNGEGSGTLQ
ncbi:DUF1178 family protein [Comamonas testosteroni]|uniref:DUF1178 family protein n=1 Tax=Comamonas testosteroni TaxID=285 RepID=A0A373FLM7_COMTE|nr:DUF1178 family protein [Comamonas testosteroni]RGE45054.1 DUF1178 family protein [Comamonas testosteroni]